MAISQFGHILRVIKGKFQEVTEEEKQELLEQALLMALSRATRTDSDIDTTEIGTVQRVFHRVTGKDVSEQEIRVAASSEIYETEPFEVLLDRVSIQLGQEACMQIAHALGEVIRTDGRISPFEVEFFNDSVKALGLSPEQVEQIQFETD